MCKPRSSHAVALGLVLAALTPALTPAGALADQDLRSPDARDLSTPAASQPDLRSPDAADAADGRGAAQSPSVMVVRLPGTSHAGGGMDWGDAGIGAGGALIVLALGAGGAVTCGRPRPPSPCR
jgi:hypothetical protein